MAVNPEDKDYDQKIRNEFERGTGNFSENELGKVLKDESTARQKAKNLKGFFDEFLLCFNLLKDYKSGKYRAPWKLIAAVGFSALYLISPVDLIPDFIPVLGYVDDLSVFALVASTFKAEIEEYRLWKEKEIDL